MNSNSFPRVATLNTEDASYKRIKSGSNKDKMMIAIYHLQAERDQLNGKLALATTKAQKVQLQGWSDTIKKFRSLALEQAHRDTKKVTRACYQEIKLFFA